ncbi:ABC transporter permease, partial [Streptomyces sp. T-3]|nr:ABC transporter permease [Streptomyces sp. T-3]
MKTVAPWVRTRLRTAPTAVAALMLLALVTSFLAAAFPRGVDTYEGDGLRKELAGAPADRSAVQLTDLPGGADSMSPRQLGRQYREIVGTLPDPLRADPAQSAYGARTTKPAGARDTWLPELDGGRPVFTLSTQSGLAKHAEVRKGRLPEGGSVPAADSGSATGGTVEAAVTSATAKTLHIKVGSVLHIGALTVKVTGIVEPTHAERSYWSVEPVLGAPTHLFKGQPVPVPYWHGALLLAPDAAPALLSLSEAEVYWRIAPDPAGLAARDLPALKETVASLEHGPLQAKLGTVMSPDLTIETGLDDLLIQYDGIVAAINPVVAVAAFGVGSVAGIVLVMAGGLIAARRHRELALLRSRGGSVRGIAGRLLAET